MQEETLKLIKKDYELQHDYNENQEENLFLAYMRYINIIKEEDTNDIYLFVRTDVEDLNIVNIYWNIEQPQPINIKIEDVEDFEKNHTVLKPMFGNLSAKDVIKIQKVFIQKAVESNQEKARKLVIRRYSSKQTSSGIIKR